MKTIQVTVSEADIARYNLEEQKIEFTDLGDKISLEYAQRALLESNQIARQVGLSNMTLNDINAEIKAVWDAKSDS